MNWQALGENPVPGDDGAVRVIAERVRSVAESAEEIVGRLRGVDGGVGPAVWKGPAADVFRARLGEVGPATIRFADAHRVAQDALRAYADALAAAQEVAQRAEAAGQQAIADRDDARRWQESAAATAASATAQGVAVGERVQQAQTLRTAATDPTYAAQLDVYIQQTTAVQQRARAQAADAHQAAQQAGAAVTSAAARLSNARTQGARAAEDCRVAAQALVSALRSVTPGSRAGSSFWNGAVGVVKTVVEDGEAVAGAAEKFLVQEYKRNGKTFKRWQKGLGKLREKYGFQASTVGRVEKALRRFGTALGGEEGAQKQWAEDGDDPGMSTGERSFRAAGAGAASAGLSALNSTVSKVAMERAGMAAGAFVGSFIPVPVVGTVAGAVVGAAAGYGASWLIDEAEKRFDLEDKAREFGAAMGSEVYQDVTDVAHLAGSEGKALVNGAEDTAGQIWKKATSWKWKR